MQRLLPIAGAWACLTASAAVPPPRIVAPNIDPTCAVSPSLRSIGNPYRSFVHSDRPTVLSIPVASPGGVYVETRERGIDVEVEVEYPEAGRTGTVRADNPVLRSGARRLIADPPQAGPIRLRITSKEHPQAIGHTTTSVYVVDAKLAADPCFRVLQQLAAADRDYAAGQAVTRGQVEQNHAATRHSYLRAAEEYLASYALAGAARSKSLQVEAALALASEYYQDLKDWPRAADWAVRARDVAAKANDPYDRARAEAILAAAWIEDPSIRAGPETDVPMDAHHRLEATRALLTRVEAFHLSRGEIYDAALQRNNIGLAYFNESNFDLGEPEFRESARRFAAMNEAPRLGIALQNIAICEWGRGELTRAERQFRNAERYLTAASHSPAYVLMLSNHAIISHALGQLDQALRLGSEALAIAERQDARIAIGMNLHGLGMSYYALGDREQSRDYLERAHAFHTPDVRSYVSTLRALANVYRDEGRHSDSKRVASEALALATSASAKARIRIGIARDDAALGRQRDALEALDGILAETAGHSGTIRAEALLARSDVRASNGDFAGSQRDLEETLELLRHLEDPTDEFQARLALARVHRHRGALEEGLREADRALRLADVLRLSSANPDLRARRQEPLRPAYELKIDLLMDLRAGHLARGEAESARLREIEALTVAEESRAQSLADIEAESVSKAGTALMDAALRRRAELYRDIAARQFQLDARRDLAGDDDARVGRYQSEISALRREADILSADIARQAGGHAVRGQVTPLSWSRWLKARSPDTAILEYWVGEETAYAWTINKEGIVFRRLGLSDTVNQAARALHAAMRGIVSTPAARRVEAAHAFYTAALRPIESSIGGQQRWIVVPDRAVAYVPFATLVVAQGDSPTYLVQTHDVSVTPAAWWLFRPTTRRLDSGASREILIVADPVYDGSDPRVAGMVRGAKWHGPGLDRQWQRLPWSAKEADAISRLFPPRAADRLEGLAATRERVLSAPLSQYRFIHVAAHGSVDARWPQLSAIILGSYGDGGQAVDRALMAVDLLPVRFHADVITLSACDTALGKEAAGEGVMGLSYVALARGAHAVVSSLWDVSDEMTVTLMTEFYGKLLHTPDVPAALGYAMRTMLMQSPTLDPALWGAFQVSIGGPLASLPLRSPNDAAH